MVSDIVSRQLRGAVLLTAMMGFVQSMLGGWAEVAAVAIGAFGLYFVSFAVHEAGHYAVAAALRAQPVVTMEGVESRPNRKRQAVWISLAGPLAGVTVSLAVLGISAPKHIVGLSLTAVVLALNHLAMLLPVFPDGRVVKQAITKELE